MNNEMLDEVIAQSRFENLPNGILKTCFEKPAVQIPADASKDFCNGVLWGISAAKHTVIEDDAPLARMTEALQIAIMYQIWKMYYQQDIKPSDIAGDFIYINRK